MYDRQVCMTLSYSALAKMVAFIRLVWIGEIYEFSEIEIYATDTAIIWRASAGSCSSSSLRLFSISAICLSRYSLDICHENSESLQCWVWWKPQESNLRNKMLAWVVGIWYGIIFGCSPQACKINWSDTQLVMGHLTCVRLLTPTRAMANLFWGCQDPKEWEN